MICLALHIEKLTVASKWRMDCWAEAGRAVGMRAGVGDEHWAHLARGDGGWDQSEQWVN